MPLKVVLGGLLWLWLPVSLAVIPAAELPKQSTRAVSSGDIASWSLGLIVVLSVFFLCVWGMRKLGGTNMGGEKMRMVAGLSLGLREKIIVLQVGKKQLVLGVTPGRIQTLLILEGDDCLKREDPAAVAVTAAGFGQKLVQALKGGPDA